MPLRSQQHLISMGRVASNGQSPDFWPGSITSMIALPGPGFARLIIMPGIQCDRLRIYRVPTGQPLNKATHQIADIGCKPGVEVQYVDGDPNIINIALTEGTPGRQWVKNVSFHDTFDRANAALNASPVAAYGGSWVHDGLIANAAAVDTNTLKGNTADTVGSAYKAPSPGSADHFAQFRAIVNSTGGPLVCCRLVDRNNFVGFRATTTWVDVFRRLNGTFNTLFSGGVTTPFDVLRLECSGSTWTLKKNGAVVQTGAIPADQPSSTDVGFVARTSAIVTFDDVAFGALSTSGKYVHLNTNLDNRAMTSTDGINWSAQTVPTDGAPQTWYAVCYSPDLNLFYAIATTGGTPTNARGMSSPDGINWTVRNNVTNTNVGICWGGPAGDRRFILVTASTSTGNIQTSPDGIAWTARSKVDNLALRAVCWSPEKSLYVAVGDGGAVYTSPEGTNWTKQTGATNSLSVCWSKEKGLFVAVGGGGTTRSMTSPDGVTWTQSPLDASKNAAAWTGVCWSPERNLFVACSRTGTDRIMYSSDGINWTQVAGGFNASYEGVCWSPPLGLFVIVTSNGSSRVLTSPDGINWTPRINGPFANTWFGVCWAGSPQNKFVAVGQASGINPELLTWSGLGLKDGDKVRWSMNLLSGQAGRVLSDPSRNVGSLLSTLGINMGTTVLTGADYNAFGFYTNTNVAAALDSVVFYKETAKTAPQGYWDYHVYATAGVGTESDVASTAIGVLVT